MLPYVVKGTLDALFFLFCFSFLAVCLGNEQWKTMRWALAEIENSKSSYSRKHGNVWATSKTGPVAGAWVKWSLPCDCAWHMMNHLSAIDTTAKEKEAIWTRANSERRWHGPYSETCDTTCNWSNRQCSQTVCHRTARPNLAAIQLAKQCAEHDKHNCYKTTLFEWAELIIAIISFSCLVATRTLCRFACPFLFHFHFDTICYVA